LRKEKNTSDFDIFDFERTLWKKGLLSVAGIDEAGRGPLAGPLVVASAIFLQNLQYYPRVNDSKKLSPRQRDSLFDELLSMNGFKYSIVEISPSEIDRINIFESVKKAMIMAAEQLQEAELYLVDGIAFRGFKKPVEFIVKGDSKSASIAAASIIAKVSRDRIMEELDKNFPQYGFAQHKGYGTKAHIEAIKKYGPSEAHRMSFAPIKDYFGSDDRERLL